MVNMVSIKEGIESAMAFARATLGQERTEDLRLEEIESTAVGDEAWLITLSMPSPNPLGISNVFGVPKREYKSFLVAKRDGEVKSMKIREFANA
jgi:hypothetical protein